MWIVVSVNSHTNRDSNGRYLLSTNGNVDFTIGDIASFFEVQENEVDIVRVFNHCSAGDDSFMLPSIEITADEWFFE